MQPSKEMLVLLVRDIVDKEGYQPPLLPEVALALSRLASRPNVAIAEVETLVARDPAIAARVLARANSAEFRRGHTVDSLRIAIMRLGLGHVRDMAFHVVMQSKILKVPAYTKKMRHLLDAAQAGAVIARRISNLLGTASEFAYLCGLLQDLGEAIILGAVAELAREKNQSPPPREVLEDTIEQYHSLVGKRVCEAWNLPEVVVDAIAHHHRPDASSFPEHFVAEILFATDALVEHAGIGRIARSLDSSSPELQRLGIPRAELHRLLQEVDLMAVDRSSWQLA